MSLKLATETLEKLKCSRCCCLLSVPPITFTKTDGFLCGRCNPCNSKTANNNVPYEILAQHFYFPCRYENFGCKQRHTFQSVATHEKHCDKRPFLCPLLPRGVCLWRGNELARHLGEKHADCFVDAKIVDFDMEKAPQICNKAFVDDGKCFLLRCLFNKTKGFTINLLEMDGNNKEFGIQIHSFDFKRSIKISACKTSQINAECDGCFVDANTLKFISTKKLLIEVIFDEVSSKVDKTILNLLECPVCMEFMTHTIHQCKTGHSFCENCHKKLPQCPICKCELTNTFNYALMQLSAQIYFPCKNKEIGCSFEGFANEIAQHESFCRRFKCPACSFTTGETHDLHEHCTQKHDYLTQENHNVKWSLKAKDTTITKIICAYDRVFRSCRKFTGKELLWTVKFCGGGEEDGQGFIFSVEFERAGKKLVFSECCTSVRDETRVFDNGTLCIPWFQLRGFVCGDFCINNICIIKRDEYEVK